MDKNIKGVSILESLVCIVIIGIGFIAMLQLSSYSINAMDRSLEKNKLNFLSEMVLEDMIGDIDNVSNYSGFNQSGCSYSAKGGSDLHKKNKDKWRNKLQEKNFIKFDKGSGYKNKKPTCSSTDIKKTIVNNGAGRVNFFTGGLKKDNTPKRKKYLGVLVK